MGNMKETLKETRVSKNTALFLRDDIKLIFFSFLENLVSLDCKLFEEDFVKKPQMTFT
jgi:hypothetical protein